MKILIFCFSNSQLDFHCVIIIANQSILKAIISRQLFGVCRILRFEKLNASVLGQWRANSCKVESDVENGKYSAKMQIILDIYLSTRSYVGSLPLRTVHLWVPHSNIHSGAQIRNFLPRQVCLFSTVPPGWLFELQSLVGLLNTRMNSSNGVSLKGSWPIISLYCNYGLFEK